MWAYTADTGGDSASKHVTVRPPSLQLTASKSTLEAPGQDVSFTAMGNGRLVVLGWSFTEDGGAMDRVALSRPSLSLTPASSDEAGSLRSDRTLPRSIRNMLKPLGRTADERARPSQMAAPASSRKLASQGSAWGACSPSSTNCTNFVGVSGTVDVLASVNGDTLRVSVHVTVVPCPTKDPNLDNPLVRAKLDSLWLLARSGNNKNSWRERAISGYDSSGTLIVRILQLDSTATPCRTPIVDPVPAPGQKLFDMHVHPFAVNDSLPAACNDPSIILRPNQFMKYGHTYGGLSGADWTHTAVHNPPVPVYTFDADSVYRGFPGANFTYIPAKQEYIPTNWQQFYQSWPRRGPGCEIVRY